MGKANNNDDHTSIVPMIDIGSWTTMTTNNHQHQDTMITFSSLSKEQQAVVEEISKACQSIGFFTIENHGVNTTMMDHVWQASREFFNQPSSEKMKLKTSNEQQYPYGYEQSEQLTKGKALEQKGEEEEEENLVTLQQPDPKETFSIGPDNIQSGMPLRKWPTNFQNTTLLNYFKDSVEEYYFQMEQLSIVLMKLFALALDLPIHYFVERSTHHMSALRLIHYFPIVTKENNNDSTPTIRAGAHSDYGAFTILNAAGPGLQVYIPTNNDKQQYNANSDNNNNDNGYYWYSVPMTKLPNDALVINLGDLMQRWTNDKWVSTMHRVISVNNNNDNDNSSSIDGGNVRYSMAYFMNINGETIVEPLVVDNDENTNNKKYKKYPPITAKDHLMAKHLASMGEELLFTNNIHDDTAKNEEL